MFISKHRGNVTVSSPFNPGGLLALAMIVGALGLLFFDTGQHADDGGRVVIGVVLMLLAVAIVWAVVRTIYVAAFGRRGDR